MTLFPIIKIKFFWFRFFFIIYLFIFFRQKVFLSSVNWRRGGAEVFFLAGFESLGLDSSNLKSLVLEPWVFTFEKVLWDEKWPLGQQVSKFQTMALNLRPVLAFLLIAFYTIPLKLVDALSCYSILILIKSLKLFQKYWIIVGLSEALIRSNSIEMNWRCWRFDTQSRAFFSWYWESFLYLLQILSMKAWKFMIFFQKKVLNSNYLIEVAL